MRYIWQLKILVRQITEEATREESEKVYSDLVTSPTHIFLKQENPTTTNMSGNTFLGPENLLDPDINKYILQVSGHIYKI